MNACIRRCLLRGQGGVIIAVAGILGIAVSILISVLVCVSAVPPAEPITAAIWSACFAAVSPFVVFTGGVFGTLAGLGAASLHCRYNVCNRTNN